MRVAKVDTEAQQALGSRYQIRSIPTLALFVNGREVARQAGAMSASDIVRWTLENIPDLPLAAFGIQDSRWTDHVQF